MLRIAFSRLVSIAVLLWSGSILAHPAPVHTWHNVYLQDPDNFSWSCQLSATYETDFYFVDSAGNRITSFEISNQTSFCFGFSFGPHADFNLLYSLTCNRNGGKIANSPRVSFLIGASGPADPNIFVNQIDGGLGYFKVVPNTGENFYLSATNQTNSQR